MLYESQEQFLATAVPFVAEGVRQGEKVILACSAANSAAVSEDLGKAATTVEFGDTRVWYSKPSELLNQLHDRLRELFQTHRGRIRVLAEPDLAGRPASVVREQVRCEAAANAVLEFSGADIVCPYDVRRMPADLLADVCRTHPQVIGPEGWRPNLDYQDPQEFLRGKDAGHEFPEAPRTAARLHGAPPALVRRFVTTHARVAGLDEDRLSDFVTAVNEICTNAEVHALPSGVRVWWEDGCFVCEVRDYGFGLDDPLASYRPPETGQRSGRGLWMSRRLADLMEVASSPSGTTIRLHVALPR